MQSIFSRVYFWPRNFLDKILSPWGLACLSIIGAAIIIFGERDFTTTPFVLAVFCAIWMALLAITKRLRFSLVACWVLITVITVICTMKLHYMGLGLHVFDFYFYERNTEIYRFLIDAYLPAVLVSLATLAVGIVVCVLIYRRDATIKTSRAVLSGLCLAAIVVAGVTDPRPAHDQSYHLSAHRTSSFFVSLSDLRFLVAPPAFVKRLSASTSQAGYQGLEKCSSAKSRPDIVAVLMESAVPPSTYSAIKADAALNDRFRSADGVIHPLRVAIFGGGTWITTASLMTSLPAAEFGWLRPYLPVYLEGHVHHSLPELLRKCGYKTAVISPLDYHFVNEGPFLTSLGFEDYLDAGRIHAPSEHERDTFYFKAALDYIRQHRAKDGRPLFLFMMTMAAHGPYSYRFKPDIKVPGEPFSNDQEVNEYLRRLTMQQMDFASFKRDLAKLDDKRGTIFLDFGDHQPSATLPLAEAADGEKTLTHWDSIAYRTYYRIEAMHTSRAPTLPKYKSMAVAYLAPALIRAAGLPIDDVYAELLSLRKECHGTFFLCSDHARVEHYLQRLAKGHLLDLDTEAPAQVVLAALVGPAMAQRAPSSEPGSGLR